MGHARRTRNGFHSESLTTLLRALRDHSGFLSIFRKPTDSVFAPPLARFIENLARFAKSNYFLAT
jgi:hypothetical protein